MFWDIMEENAWVSFKQNTSCRQDGNLKLIRDESGYIMVTAIFVLAILTITATAISMLSQTESNTVKSERTYLSEFFNADSAVTLASEKSTGADGWATELNKSENQDKGYSYKVKLNGESGPETVVEVFRIKDEPYKKSDYTPAVVGFRKDKPNEIDLPQMKHIDEPLVGSGTGVTGEVKIRRYAIAAKPADGNVQIQTGVYKYIPGSGY
jgi:Na+-transporting methylmalonyl-CoA/oxaloacetate decarboxylase gamma subunit